MNYEQKYKEALGWMQSLYSGLHGKTKEEAERYFPELTESEEELTAFEKTMIQFSHERNSLIQFEHTTEEINAHLYLYSKKLLDLARKKNEKENCDGKQGKQTDKGEISDGYHTFNELYYYRMLYNAAFFNMLPKEWVHKSKKHHDGEECFGGGWFIVMANLPTGQISNHYELKDWNLFQIPEKEVADKWDGHTPQEAADRLHKYLLEKQCEHKPVISDDALREGIAHFGITQYQIDNWMKKYVDVEKQGEQILANSAKTCKDRYSPKFRVGDTIKCKYDDRQFTIKSVDFNKGTYTYTQEGCGNDIDYADEEFELVEQKPADKVQPKFKVGDWIVSNIRSGSELLHIIDMDNENYEIETPQGNTGVPSIEFIDNNFHLWTIQDAKLGDVLANEDMVLIFKCFEEPSYRQHIIAYIGLDTCGFIQVTNGYWSLGLDCARPATKEQRDLLFQKMKEAGYKWDSDKKELKKIGQNPAWSEKDEKILNAIIMDIQERHPEAMWEVNAGRTVAVSTQYIIDWLKTMKPEQNKYDKGFNDGYSAAKYNQWRPGEEQMEARKETSKCEEIEVVKEQPVKKHCGDCCTDGRFEMIERVKNYLKEATNIETSEDEMKVIDNILFRFWQMDWLEMIDEKINRDIR